MLTGLTFFVGDGTADATMRFRATIATINLRLSGATFIPTKQLTGAASLQILTSDLGNVGTGGTLTDTDSVIVNVNSLGVFTASQDISVPPGTTGSSAYSAGTYTVAGRGEDIWNNADHFQFVHVPMTGDGRLTAKVVSQAQSPAPASAPAKAGVMLPRDPGRREHPRHGRHDAGERVRVPLAAHHERVVGGHHRDGRPRRSVLGANHPSRKRRHG